MTTLLRAPALLLLASIACLPLASPAARADGAAAGNLAEITPNDGSATYYVQRGDKALDRPDSGTPLQAGDVIATGPGAVLTLSLSDNSHVVVGPNSKFTLDTVSDAGGHSNSALSVAYGFVRAVVDKVYSGTGQSFQVTTGNCVMGVRGTQFIVEAPKDSHGHTTTTLSTIEGIVAISGSASAVEKDKTRVEKGFMTTVVGAHGNPSTPVAFTKEALLARLEKQIPGRFAKLFLEKDVLVKAGGADGVDFGLKKSSGAAKPKSQ